MLEEIICTFRSATFVHICNTGVLFLLVSSSFTCDLLLWSVLNLFLTLLSQDVLVVPTLQVISYVFSDVG